MDLFCVLVLFELSQLWLLGFLLRAAAEVTCLGIK